MAFIISKHGKAELRYIRRKFRENRKNVFNIRRAYIRGLYNELNDMN